MESNDTNVTPAQVLFKALLSFSFYDQHKEIASADLFPKELQALYSTIEHSHKKHQKDLTVDDLISLHQSLHPTITNANLKFIKSTLGIIRIIPELNEATITEALNSCYRAKLGTELADISLKIGLENNFSELERAKELLHRLENKLYLDEDNTEEIKYISTDVEAIFTELDNLMPWKFNLPGLQENLGGIGPGTFGVIAATPDTGKTAFWVNLVFGPGGWLEQGARVHVIANEEPANKIMARGISCNTGFTKDEILTKGKMQLAKDQFGLVSKNIFIRDSVDLYLEQIDKYAAKAKLSHGLDIFIIDQLDKIKLKDQSKFRTDESLKKLYTGAREIAKRNQIAVIAISQASDKATGRLYYGFDALENSRIGKAAEADYVLCIGMESIAANNGIDSGYRVCNFPKNKLTGLKSPVAYMLNHNLSRMVP